MNIFFLMVTPFLSTRGNCGLLYQVSIVAVGFLNNVIYEYSQEYAFDTNWDFSPNRTCKED
jgi:hypothetical protein